MVTDIPCLLMRGGTSKGAYFLRDDLPADAALRERVLLRIMGSPDPRQIDGLGGADPLTSKVAIVSKSTRPDADVDYLFRSGGRRRSSCGFRPELRQPVGRGRTVRDRAWPGHGAG